MEVICKICKNIFVDQNCPSRRRTCCSKKCSLVASKSTLVHGCREGSSNWKGGRFVDKKSGYIRVLAVGHPMADSKGYVQEHRLLMANKIGRMLLPKEIVHHINKVRNDNRIENLILMSDEEHKSFHGKGKVMPVRWKK